MHNAKLRAAVDKVSAGTANYARLLQLEHRTENVKLNFRELTLQFSPLSGRTDFLWEVGSGQNWVGYHVAGMLALHEHFLGMHDSPVANFLVIDQPSQVYFPEAWPSMEQAPERMESRSVARYRRCPSHLRCTFSVPRQCLRAISDHRDRACRFNYVARSATRSSRWKLEGRPRRVPYSGRLDTSGVKIG